MTRKKKIRMLVMMPALMSVLVVGGLLTLVFSIVPLGAHEAPPRVYNAGDAEGVSEGDAGLPVVGGGAAGVDAVTDEAAPDAPLPACDFASWVGKPVDEAAVKATGRPWRVLQPGVMVTMEYQEGRINIQVDDAGIVTGVTCG